MSYRILTNNPLVLEHYAPSFSVDYITGNAEEVFEAVEEALQTGWELLTSPLPPNVPLIRSPIRTVVLRSSGKKYDVAGLGYLAKARERTQTLAKSHREEQRGDLAHIDWTFAERAMLELGLSATRQRSSAA